MTDSKAPNPAPNPTAVKFGYPETLIREYGHWAVLLRPQQCTLGTLVLLCKDDAAAFSDISSGAFAEFGSVIADIERGLTDFRPYRKINYLMLMMKDNDVHFHVLPRYDLEQEFDAEEYRDAGWPGPPDLGAGVTLAGDARAALVKTIRASWPSVDS